MKLIIAGGRDCTEYDVLTEAIRHHQIPITQDTEIVCGMAKGADSLGFDFAIISELKIHKFPAKWNLHGRKAGPLRNIEMGDFADALLALWDGKSKGTKHMIDYATKRGLKVWVHHYVAPEPEPPIERKGI